MTAFLGTAHLREGQRERERERERNRRIDTVHLSLALREAYIIVASRDSVARWAVDGPCCRVRVDDKNRRRQRVATRSADCIVSAFRPRYTH